MPDQIQRHFESGFTIIDNRIFESRDFDKLIDKYVYMSLLKFSYGKSCAFPSVDTLAAHCLCVKNTLKDSIKRLEKRSYISKEQRVDEKGNHKSNIYHLYEIPSFGVGQKLTEGRSIVAPGVGQKLTPNNKNLEEDELKNTIVEIVNYLNEKAAKNYKPTTQKTRSLIASRIHEGFSLNEFKSVIEKKCRQWLHDPKMSRYVRPSTLFSPKFEEYLNEPEGNGPDDDVAERWARGD